MDFKDREGEDGVVSSKKEEDRVIFKDKEGEGEEEEEEEDIITAVWVLFNQFLLIVIN